MFGHFPELIIILAIALIIFGPEKLPEVAANAGRMVRELRDMVDVAMMNPQDRQVPDDFSTYYHESLARAGEEVPEAEHVEQDDLAPFVLEDGEIEARPEAETSAENETA